MRAQVSIEYLILAGFFLGIVIIPTAYFIYSYQNNVLFGTSNTYMINNLGNGLVSDAKEIYHLGLYSQHSVEYELPKIESMAILEIDETYYVIILLGETHYLYQSDVPIYSEDASVSASYVDIPECDYTSCKFYVFDDLKEGRRNIKYETKLDDSKVKVSIRLLEE